MSQLNTVWFGLVQFSRRSHCEVKPNQTVVHRAGTVASTSVNELLEQNLAEF